MGIPRTICKAGINPPMQIAFVRVPQSVPSIRTMVRVVPAHPASGPRTDDQQAVRCWRYFRETLKHHKLLLEFLALFRYWCGSCAKTFGQSVTREARHASSALEARDCGRD
jgi:hypothetical protein